MFISVSSNVEVSLVRVAGKSACTGCARSIVRGRVGRNVRGGGGRGYRRRRAKVGPSGVGGPPEPSFAAQANFAYECYTYSDFGS